MDNPDVSNIIKPYQIWNHWIFLNIRTYVTEPPGVHALATSNSLYYFSRFPPDRKHRYLFKF